MSLSVALLVLATVPAAPPAAWVVAGGTYKPGPALQRAHVTAPAKGGLELLTTGRCLLRLAPSASLRLESIAPGTTCPRIRLLKGRVRITAPGKRSVEVLLGNNAVVLRGDAQARRDGVTGLCVHSGSARHRPAPQPPPAAAPPKKRRPGTATKGRCLWLTATAATVSAYVPEAAAKDRRRSGALYDFATPPTAVRFDLGRDVARASARIRSGKGGSGEVETGSQSMCLDSGSDGSAADLGSSVDVTKPPPPTQLRVRVTLHRRSP